MDMTLNEARNVLSVTLDATAVDIKQAFRRASSLHHPDKGGSTQAMQSVTAAYEILATRASIDSKTTERDYDRAQHAKKWRDLAEQIRSDLERLFEPSLFTEYFTTVFNEPVSLVSFTASPSAETLDKLAERDRSPHHATISAEWRNKDRSKVLELSISVYLADAYKASGQLASEDITYPMGVSTFFYKDGRKIKITKRDYDRTQRASVLTNPEIVFPKAKLTKPKKTAFKRADMDAALTAELGATKSSNGNYYLPLAGGKLFTIYRSTMMRKGVWNVLGVWIDKGLIKSADRSFKNRHIAFMESEDTLNMFRQIVGMEPQAALDHVDAEYKRLIDEMK